MALPHQGQLDHRLTVRRATTAANAYNELVETWTDYTTVWAQRIDATAGEAARASEVGAKITVHFVVRYSTETATITPKDRLVLEGGFTYDVTGVRELARNQWLEVHAVARADR